MQSNRKPSQSRSILCALALASLAFLSGPSGRVEARGGGGNQSQVKLLLAQAEMNAKIAAAQKKKDQEILARFDLNKNGKIDTTEKPAWDKFWRDVRTGKTPHPYDSLDLTSKTAARKGGNKNKTTTE